MKQVRRLLWAIIETAWLSFVLIALLIWILPDFFPKRRRK